MDPITIAAIFGGVLQILDSIKQSQGTLTAEQEAALLIRLRAGSQARMDTFNELTKDAAPFPTTGGEVP